MIMTKIETKETTFIFGILILKTRPLFGRYLNEKCKSWTGVKVINDFIAIHFVNVKQKKEITEKTKKKELCPIWS